MLAENNEQIFLLTLHQWMAARSDLDNARVKSEYERGYKTLLEFFAKHLWVWCSAPQEGRCARKAMTDWNTWVTRNDESSSKLWCSLQEVTSHSDTLNLYRVEVDKLYLGDLVQREVGIMIWYLFIQWRPKLLLCLFQIHSFWPASSILTIWVLLNASYISFKATSQAETSGV